MCLPVNAATACFERRLKSERRLHYLGCLQLVVKVVDSFLQSCQLEHLSECYEHEVDGGEALLTIDEVETFACWLALSYQAAQKRLRFVCAAMSLP